MADKKRKIPDAISVGKTPKTPSQTRFLFESLARAINRHVPKERIAEFESEHVYAFHDEDGGCLTFDQLFRAIESEKRDNPFRDIELEEMPSIALNCKSLVIKYQEMFESDDVVALLIELCDSYYIELARQCEVASKK
jgi:hypothetical protein